jgi:hypothetical protein
VPVFARAAPRNALLAFALLAVVAELSLRPMAESDLFFRIKSGQEILAQHRLPGRNLFSFTYPDYPDVDAAWLFEVGAAALYARGGFPAVVVAKTALLLVTFGLAFWLCRRRGAGPVAAAVALAAAALAGRARFVERPHVVSLLGVVGLLLAIDALARPGARVARAAVLVCAGVGVWANFHAGAFVAPLLLACAAAGALLDRERPSGGNASAGRLALVAIGAAAALFATPIGFGLIRYLRLHLTLPALHPVDEFRAPTWLSDPEVFLYGAAFVITVGAFVFGRRARRFGWTQALPALALALLAARSVRFTADFALVSAPLLAVGLTAAGEAARARWPQVAWDQAGVVGVTALLLGMAAGPAVAGASGGVGLDTRELPLSAIAFVDANGLRDRMYNDFEIGSYLLFEPGGGYPHHRVFVDPRLPAYPPEFHRLLGRADLTRAEWSAAMDRYGVETALLAYAGINARVAWWDPERYALVFREADARVFVRRLPRFAAIIARYEIPATFAFTPQDGTATLPLEDRPAASPVPDCEWQRRLGDLTFDLDGTLSTRTLAAYDRALAGSPGCLRASDEAHLAAWLGALALGAGRAADALPLLDRALAHGDHDLATLTNRAVALEAMGRTSAAVAAWEAVIAREGATPLGARARTRRDRLLGR